MYEKEDAIEVVSWFKNEKDYHLWCASCFGTYPIEDKDLNTYYFENNMYPFIFMKDNQIVGHIGIRFKDVQTVHLCFVCVNPNFRKQFVGTTMIQMVEKYLIQLHIQNMTLNVFEENEAAMSLYKRCGFEIEQYNNLKKRYEMRKEIQYA